MALLESQDQGREGLQIGRVDWYPRFVRKSRKIAWTLTNQERSDRVLKVCALIESWMKLHASFVNRVGGFDEARQILSLEAFQAIEDANRKGLKDSTCVYRRFGYRMKEILGNQQLIRVPRADNKFSGKLRKANNQLRANAARTVFDEEVTHAVALSYPQEAIDAAIDRKDLVEAFRGILASMSDRQAEILRRKFGIGCPALQTPEIAELFNTTARNIFSEISRIKAAIRKKHPGLAEHVQ